MTYYNTLSLCSELRSAHTMIDLIDDNPLLFSGCSMSAEQIRTACMREAAAISSRLSGEEIMDQHTTPGRAS